MGLSQLDLSVGAIEIGVNVSTLMYGIMTVQAYLYARSCGKDSPWLRAFVALVWALETAHQTMVWSYLYSISVTNYGNPLALTRATWVLGTFGIIGGFLGALVQFYFSYRVYMMSQKVWLALIPSCITLFNLGATTASGSICIKMVDLVAFKAQYNWLLLTTLITLIVADVWTAAALCWLLSRNRTRFTNTTMVLDKLIAWTIETCVATCCASIVTLIFVQALPNSTLWLSGAMFYSKMYSNAMLASLNGRETLRHDNTSQPTRFLSFVPRSTTVQTTTVVSRDPKASYETETRETKQAYDSAIELNSHQLPRV